MLIPFIAGLLGLSVFSDDEKEDEDRIIRQIMNMEAAGHMDWLVEEFGDKWGINRLFQIVCILMDDPEHPIDPNNLQRYISEQREVELYTEALSENPFFFYGNNCVLLNGMSCFKNEIVEPASNSDFDIFSAAVYTLKNHFDADAFGVLDAYIYFNGISGSYFNRLKDMFTPISATMDTVSIAVQCVKILGGNLEKLYPEKYIKENLLRNPPYQFEIEIEIQCDKDKIHNNDVCFDLAYGLVQLIDSKWHFVEDLKPSIGRFDVISGGMIRVQKTVRNYIKIPKLNLNDAIRILLLSRSLWHAYNGFADQQSVYQLLFRLIDMCMIKQELDRLEREESYRAVGD